MLSDWMMVTNSSCTQNDVVARGHKSKVVQASFDHVAGVPMWACSAFVHLDKYAECEQFGVCIRRYCPALGPKRRSYPLS